MNSRYWGKTVIKPLNLTNSVYNFSNNGSVIENSGIKTSTLAREHVSAQGTLTRECVSTKGTLVREHVSMEGTLARDHVSTQDTLTREHVSTQGTLAREHLNTEGTLTRKHVRTQVTLAREHVFSTQGTKFSRLKKFMFASCKPKCFNQIVSLFDF